MGHLKAPLSCILVRVAVFEDMCSKYTQKQILRVTWKKRSVNLRLKLHCMVDKSDCGDWKHKIS